MSTRSGRRIHKSLHENTISTKPPDTEGKSERKTRGRRGKVECEALNISLPKQRKNYVTYPATDEDASSESQQEDPVEKPARHLRKHTLKEINVELGGKQSPAGDSIQQTSDAELKDKPVRSTRRTKHITDKDTKEEVVTEVSKKTKRYKKKSIDNNEKENDSQEVTGKKKKKKKGGRKTKSTEKTEMKDKQRSLNNSNASADSFHSAAGSPLNQKLVEQKLNNTYDAADKSDTTPEQETVKRNSTRKSIKDRTFDKNTDSNDKLNSSFDMINASSGNIDTTFDKKPTSGSSRKSLNSSTNLTRISKNLDLTFEKESDTKLDSTYDKNDEQNKNVTSNEANISIDKSEDSITKISITSDESLKSPENIMNTTPVLIESSMETSQTPETLTKSSTRNTNSIEKPKQPVTPLKREGTFTKDGPDPIIMSPQHKVTTPQRRKSLPSPGRTPYHSGTKPPGAMQKNVLNLTHSIEKPSRRSSLMENSRVTRVMFCSPVNNPVLNTQRKSKIIKSSLKGSNKSFLFEDKAPPAASNTRPSSRKRSFTHDAEEARGGKRKKLAEEMRQSVDRLSRPRTVSASAKLSEPPTPSKQPTTPSKKPATPSKKPTTPKPEAKSLGKLPNFAAMHQRRFQKMESLDECQERKAKRAKQLLVPTGKLAVLERSSPRVSVTEPPKSVAKETETKKQHTVPKTKSATEASKPGYTRFGFKLNLDVNPFSIPSKTIEAKPQENKLNGVRRQPTMPSINGTTTTRKDVAKMLILREKSSTTLRERRNNKRDETRTIIKGVRTNRRFELQMKSRNICG